MTTLASIVTKTARNVFILNTVILVTVVVSFGASWRYWYNYLYGPFIVNGAALGKVASEPNPKEYFLTVTGRDRIDTGYRNIRITKNKYTQTETNREVSFAYVALVTGDKALLVGTDETASDKFVFTGSLKEIPADVKRGLRTDLKWTDERFDSAFYPMMLHAVGDFRLPGHLGLAAGLALASIAFGCIANAVRKINDPLSHPLFKEHAKFGATSVVAQQVDEELKGTVIGLGYAHLTDTWLIYNPPFGLKIVSLLDVKWAYMKRTTHYHSFIKTGQTFTVVIFAHKAKGIEISLNETQAIQLLEGMAKRAPWPIYGYSEELESAWTNKKELFEESVRLRQQAWLQQNKPA